MDMAKKDKRSAGIELEDIIKYKIPASLEYSPDGSILAFHTSEADEKKNGYRNNVYVVKDGKVKQVTHSLDASFLFFDDDTTLVLQRKTEETAPGTTQLYKLDLAAGGEAALWITLPFIARGIKKVTDGVYAVIGVISADDPDMYKDSPDTIKKKMEARMQDKDYVVVEEVPYWFNGAGFMNRIRSALFILDLRKGFSLKRITSPEFSVDQILPCGDTVYYSGQIKKRRMRLESKLYAYDISKKKTTGLFTGSGRRFGRMFILDGQLYSEITTMGKYGLGATPDIYKIAGDGFEKVYAPDVGLNSSVIGDTVHGGGKDHFCDGKNFITLATIEDHNAVFSFDSSFKKKTVWEAPGMASFIAVSDSKIAMCYQDWKHVAEIYEMNRDGSDLKQVTSLNDAVLKDKYIAEPIPLDYISGEDQLRGWVLLPDGFSHKKQYPAVLDIHGGPRASYGETFFHEMQYWVAKGYVVFFTNIRGSDGRGDDFADIRGQYGYVDYENIMDFTDAVLEKYPEIDRRRVCETGGSYGGFMTNWIIGHTDRFCCAASQRSISNWISMSYISDIGNFFGPDQCGATGLYGEENIQKMWKHSPLRFAKNVRTPTLFIHSDEDYRCPLPEGMQMMQALAANNVETRLVIFKGENHELSRSGKPTHRIRRLKEITDWFDKYSK